LFKMKLFIILLNLMYYSLILFINVNKTLILQQLFNNI
jgi:hypothetical protein